MRRETAKNMQSATILESELRCPHCGFTSVETMPTESCLYFHRCGGCHVLLTPKPGHCCVFCSYGSVKCPPVQEARSCCSQQDSA